MPPGDDDDFGFVADEPAADDFGFEADEPTPVAVPAGTRATGNRRLVLDEMTIEGSPTGRGARQTTTAPGTGYTEIEVEEKPEKLLARRPRAPSSALERLGAGLHRGLRDADASDVARYALGGAPAVARELDLPAFGAGVVDAAQLGFADEGRAALDQAANVIAGRPTDYRGDRDRYRGELAEHQERAPGSVAFGGAVGSAPLALVPGGQSTALGRIAAAGGAGVVSGALRGAGGGTAEDAIAAYDQPSLARDAVMGGAVEGALSAGTAGVGEGAAPLIGRLGRWISNRGDDAAQAGVQSRLEGTGIWGGRAMRAAEEMPGGQEALAGDLRRLGIGHGVEREAEGVARSRFTRPERSLADAEEVRSAAGARMDSVLERMDEAASGRQGALLEGTREQAMRGMVDLSRVADEMETIAREYDRIPVGGSQVAQALRQQVVEPLSTQGAVRFSDAWRQRRVLDDMIRDWGQTPNLSTAAGRLRTARQSINRAMNEAAERLDPAIRQEWTQANRDFSVGAFVDDFGRGAERLSVGGGIGGAAGTAIENTMGQAPIVGAWAQREMAQQTRMAWPGLRAAGLEALAPRLRSLGARGQRWAQTLEAGQQRGSRGLAAAHYMLQRSDPEYRVALEQMESGDAGEE